jgi:hypothetical protein
MLPANRSPLWALAFVILALLLSGGILGLGAYRNDAPPDGGTIASVLGVMSFICATLSLIGYLGGRATFTCATLGLLGGLAHMAYVYTTSPGGMADLGALLTFLMLGGVGLVLGVAIDIIGALRARRR